MASSHPNRPPLPILALELSEAWYAWERRGRGWQIWPTPVCLEPPFRPFFYHATPSIVPSQDDGRTTSVLDAFVERIAGLFEPPAPETFVPPDPLEPEPNYLDDTPAIAELQVALRPDVKTSLAAAEQFLIAVAGPVAFEIIGTPRSITVQFACAARERARVAAQLQAYAPEATLSDGDGFLAGLWRPERPALIVEFGLAAEFMRPLASLTDRESDVLAAIAAALSTLHGDEVAVLQVLIERTRHPWAENVQRSLLDGQGEAFFLDAPDMVSLAREKTSRPLFAVVIRVAVQSARSRELVRDVAATLGRLSRPDSNELIPLANDEYRDLEHVGDLLARQSRRSGMLLNVDEVISLVHVPSPWVRSAKVVRQVRRTKPVPEVACGHDLVLGENRHGDALEPVTISSQQRSRHVHVIGGTGTGKSTFLLNLIFQDLSAGRGFAVVDPHGDLVEETLSRIPSSRIDDVVLIDPSDVERPVAFNPLQAHTEFERNLLLSDLVAVFRRLSTSWGDQMHSVLANAIAAVLESASGGTIADLRRFLVEPDFRRAFLTTVGDEEIVYYWTKEFRLFVESGAARNRLLRDKLTVITA